MADLTEVLPHFDLQPWRHLTYSLEKKNILTAELLSKDPVEIAKRCPLPLNELRRLIAAVVDALRADTHFSSTTITTAQPVGSGEPPLKKARIFREDPEFPPLQCVRTLDTNIDECLGGGFAAGCISEIVGESAVGKTQFVLGLLLSAQLPPPLGLGKAVLYLDTEGTLNTTRLDQMLSSHPTYQQLPPEDRPSLNRVLTMSVHDLEAQEHIVQFQIPETVRRYNIGLVVIDSVTANFRAEFLGSSAKVLSDRAVALVRLGNTLRRLANDHNVAIVVTNQVSDRFDDARTTADKLRLSSQAPSSSGTSSLQTQNLTPRAWQSQNTQQPRSSQAPIKSMQLQLSPSAQARKDEVMSLDFQQRFFTGWGDNPSDPFESLKTPALGLAWANQLDARIVLKIGRGSTNPVSGTGNILSEAKRKRYLGVVFASWTPPSHTPIPYTLETQGPVSMSGTTNAKAVHQDEFDVDFEEVDAEDGRESTDADLLNPQYWDDLDNDFA
ncbi:DNA repair protein rhp57 [Lithohypha guttulata]|nr:DNA repair protein rhp57 [Lithohypha guttulata]